MKLPFHICNGNGNSFIIIIHHNTLEKIFFNNLFIKDLCLYNKEISIDGLVLINIKNNEIYMDYFNNDGTWETLCLNGLRCAALLLNQKFKKDNFKINCNNHIYNTSILKNRVIKVNLTKPLYVMENISVDGFIGNYLDVGAKHFVISYDKVWPSLDELQNISRKIRYNTSMFPEGINVNFYKVLDNMKIQVKTYEKGVESMMKSCASGSYAAAYHYMSQNNLLGSLHVLNDGGDFHINFDESYRNNTLEGQAEIEYKDFIKIN